MIMNNQTPRHMSPQQDKDDKPKSSRRKKSANEDEESNVDSLVAASIRSYLEHYKERKKLNQDNVDIITSVLEEYLDTFMIIGYNYDGEMISYSHAKTQAQIDALNTGIFRFINHHAVKPPSITGYGAAEI